MKAISYKIYEYLKENAVGYENRIKASVLMEEFAIHSNKTLRSYIEEIRQDSTLQKFVCSESSHSGGYYIATSEEEVYNTLSGLYKRAMEMLKTYAILKHKASLNNQYRLKLSKYQKEIYQSIMEVEENGNIQSTKKVR